MARVGPGAGEIMSRGGWPGPPPGFVLRPRAGAALYVDAEMEGSVLEKGLADEASWSRTVGAAGGRSGRGRTVVVDGWRLKRLRRGGLAGGFWRDRYLSARRPLALLSVTLQAFQRGVPTARPVTLLVLGQAAGVVRAYFAVEDLAGFEDLASRALRREVTEAELTAALAAVRRMHDRGVTHPDLNLGNVMVRHVGDRRPEAAVIDFDRGRVLSGPVPFGARQAALRRMERSCAKLTGSPGVLGAGSEELWYTIYAAGDAALRERLLRGRTVGRMALAVHRAGWRRARS